MIFQYTLKQVLNGTKTQTRRVVKDGETIKRDDDNQIVAVLQNGRVKWRVNQTYSVQPSRNEKQVARIKMVGIGREKAGDISEADSIAEGYDNREQFLAGWETIHGKNRFDVEVWVLTFALFSVKEPDED